ncbi:hypothetical protein [Marinobacter sp. ANT_B65]|uniref:hypothetical protein n=1 Tax=Marinobacter sp. ANT_B65 TaxID=2039467 RepID=UPI000BBE7EE4|nr:hypothetical protein [Marinobacter sp. ANT_B65]PCM44912.1 hypothetical protein CPA50_02495 [Marinobacter sp. ANT_B65]
MSNSKKTSEDPNKTVGERLNILFFIAAITLVVLVILYLRGQEFLVNIYRLREHSIAVEVSNWDVPMFLAVPCFVSIIVGLVLRLTDWDRDKRIQRCVGVALIFAFLSIAVRIPYGFAVRSYMESLGYSSCWQLSSPAIMSPTVWVRNPGYCIENVGSVRNPLLEWMSLQPNGGADVAPNEVRAKAEELLAIYDHSQKMKYPEIFQEDKR